MLLLISTLVFVDPKISTQADKGRSPRVLVPFPEDPHEAIRQANLVQTDTKSEPFEDPVKTETPESPHTLASHTSLPDSTPPTCHVEELVDSDTSVRDHASDLHHITFDRESPAVTPAKAETEASIHGLIISNTMVSRIENQYMHN
ncbi:hypothetical protein Tco_1264568 [Tanacetum coccineum]